ncbi:hypothetical protein JCM8097_004606 [Rhodosporidiobolus ruineniae]
MFRFALRSAARPATRSFSSAPVARKSAVEQAKEAADTLNHKVGDTVLKGIELGEKASEATKAATKPLADAAKNLTGDASAEAKKAGADLSNKANKAASDVETAAQKAKVEAEKKL